MQGDFVRWILHERKLISCSKLFHTTPSYTYRHNKEQISWVLPLEEKRVLDFFHPHKNNSHDLRAVCATQQRMIHLMERDPRKFAQASMHFGGCSSVLTCIIQWSWMRQSYHPIFLIFGLTTILLGPLLVSLNSFASQNGSNGETQLKLTRWLNPHNSWHEKAWCMPIRWYYALRPFRFRRFAALDSFSPSGWREACFVYDKLIN